jgi:putative ABC transport system permease protein
MPFLSRFRSLWHNIIHKTDVERDLDREVQAYRDTLIESKIDQGVGAQEARRAAAIEIQGAEGLKERIREAKAGYHLEICIRDLRHGLRMLAKSPGFSVVAVLTLALGVGANSAIFSVVNAVLLRPLPFDDPDRLVRVCQTTTIGNFPLIQVTSWKDLRDWRDQNTVFEGMAVFGGDEDSYAGTDGVERIDTANVSAGFFEALHVNPILGRTFTADDRTGHRIGPLYPITGADGVTILGEAFWRQRFGSDPSIVGRSIIVDGYPSQVIGVIPDRFDSLVGHAGMYFPWVPNLIENRDERHLPVIARLRPGVTITQAAAEMDGIAARLRELYPEDNYKMFATVLPLQDIIVGNIRRMLLILLGAVGLVLLIACANVANLLLARAAARSQEVAIRSALGASRLRLLRQLLTESFALSVLGGAVALLLAFGVVKLLVKLAPGNIPRLQEVGLDPSVVGFTILLSILTAFLFGLAPALRLSESAFAESLKDAGRRARGSRRHAATRSILVVSELAISLVLLTGCGLLIRSFHKLRSVNPGFNSSNLVTADVVLIEPKDAIPGARKRFYDQVYHQIGSLGGVASVALTNFLPLGGGDFSCDGFVPEGRPFNREEQVGAQYRRVSPGYFRTMQIPLIQGREFNDYDGSNSQKVCIVSQTMARHLWPDQDPIGKILMSGENNRPVPNLVVGVVGDVKMLELDDRADMAVHVPCAQDPLPFLIVVARTASDRSQLAASIKDLVRSVDKDSPVSNIQTMDEVMERTLALRKFSLILVSAFAGLALLLAAVGAYGVISYSVAERTQEIGVRMALGATRMRIVSLVVGQGFRLGFVGIAIGLVGAFALTRLIAALLFEISPTDTVTFVLVAGFLFAVSLLASYLPARRATRVDPMRALRFE